MVAANYPSNYLLLLLVVATASIAQATITISGVEYSGVMVDGVFALPANPTVGVAGADISLSCDGGATTIGTRAVTGPTGAFRVGTTTGNGALFEESKCAVYASTPGPASVDLYAPVLGTELTVLERVRLEVVDGEVLLIPAYATTVAELKVVGTFI